ncbi:MAG: class I SAM-dependent methyltransferase [Candidatus Thiodiazotropha sp.]
MNPQPPVFDPIRYKQTTLQQWNSAAEAWHRWTPLLSRWLGPATETMFDMAGITTGSRVLDVAAGAGEQTLAAANRVGPDGYVLATDLSPEILKYAGHAARLAGHDQVRTLEIDGEDLGALDDGRFDAVISRVGLIYFPDQQRALTGMRQQLRDGGRVAAMVYAGAERNGFFSLPVSIIRRRARLPPPLPGQPGPFSLGDAEVLRKTFRAAGFREIRIETVEAPVRLGSAAECLQFEQESFGALHQMLSGLSDAQRDEAWEEIEVSLRQYEREGLFEGPCEMLIAVGTR